MTRMSKIVRQHVICVAIACFVIGFASMAFAVPPEEVLTIPQSLTLSGPCCFSFNETITVTEPAKPVPVVVTWQVLIFQSGGFNTGLMVNGGSCTAFGSGSIRGGSDSSPRIFQWVIFPSDGLRAGSNTFTLCGGGTFGDTFVAINSQTITARLSN